MNLAIVFVGIVEDCGFNAAALVGAHRLADHLLFDKGDAYIEIIDDLTYDHNALKDALHKAAGAHDGVIFVGGQGNRVVPEVAAQHSAVPFAIIQGDVSSCNVVSYHVLQEQSAYLAGALAARMTKTGVVAHLSGHRVLPGLKGRAAFCAGVTDTGSDVQVLTSFCGTQDDSDVARAWAEAQMDAGADITFTMLNDARKGAVAACLSRNTWQIGNALNWCERNPDVFLASAIARIDLAVEQAAKDIIAATRPATTQLFALQSAAVSLQMGAFIPADIKDEIDELSAAIQSGGRIVPTDYIGSEFKI